MFLHQNAVQMVKALLVVFWFTLINVSLMHYGASLVWANFMAQVSVVGNTIETKNYGTLQTPEPTTTPVIVPTPMPAPAKTAIDKPDKIGFWYNLQTSENLAGFDEPAFVVRVNDEVIYQVWASDASRPVTKKLKETGWCFEVIDLSEFPEHSVPTFSLENNDDAQHKSFIQVGKLVTDPVEIEKMSTAQSPTQVTDLQAYDDDHDDITLTWTAPRAGVPDPQPDQVSEYDLQYNNSAGEVFHQKIHAPVSAGNPEIVELHLNNFVGPVWFAVRAKNQSGIFSQFSNVVKLNLLTRMSH